MGGVILRQQHMNALLAANGVRNERARLKRGFKSGAEDPVAVLLALPRALENVEVAEFLTWVPKIGRTRARIMCLNAHVLVPTRELKRLGTNTRLRLAEELRTTVARHT
jgi:hypothetical protein